MYQRSINNTLIKATIPVSDNVRRKNRLLSVLKFDSIRSIKERGRGEVLKPQFNNIIKLIGISLELAASFCGAARVSRTAICTSICVLHFLPESALLGSREAAAQGFVKKNKENIKCNFLPRL